MIRRGQDLGFYREVPTILAELRKRKIHIAAASRTSAPELYVTLILLGIPGSTFDKGHRDMY